VLIRAILPDWAADGQKRRVLEGDFTPEQIEAHNADGYNIYWLPNHPSHYDPSKVVDGTHIDVFNYVFVDMDLKEGVYPNKDAFLEAILSETALEPSRIVDSGNGVHVYWKVSDLDPMSFLRLNRRLCRKFQTDEAVSKIYQLMRLPGTANTKNPDEPKLCEELLSTENVYTCEQLSKLLPPISQADEAYCQAHFDKTYNQEARNRKVSDQIPLKFKRLIKDNAEVKEIWSGGVDDRSGKDFRLAHIMWADGFTKAEAMSVLVNCAKALERSPVHRISYAENLVDKVWVFEETDETGDPLSESVGSILRRSNNEELKGTRFPCYNWIDATSHGFRLGQIIGLVAGVGVGKTAVALNMFMGFVKNNPDYVHFFIPLEQPANEIADRWKTMCGDQTHLHDKVHIMSNYDNQGGYRHLSLDEIKDYLIAFQEKTGKKVGCVVIDHIGVLKKKSANGENQALIDICQAMKAFAVQTRTLLVMQSQAPREKAGIGDLELDKDAAYGTVFFESFVDYLVTIWQPLKRCYGMDGCPTITAFKFCKIRHKTIHLDSAKEDTPYRLYFDPKTLHLRELTQDEEKSANYFATHALNARKRDKKSDITPYKSITWTKKSDDKAAG
jgi:hypothetical protein